MLFFNDRQNIVFPHKDLLHTGNFNFCSCIFGEKNPLTHFDFQRHSFPILADLPSTHGNNFSEDMQQLVADRTGGNYYPIYSASDLVDAHRDLGSVIVLRWKRTEVTALVALAAALLLGTSLGISTVRRGVL